MTWITVIRLLLTPDCLLCLSVGMLNSSLVSELVGSETGDIRELVNCLNRELAHRAAPNPDHRRDAKIDLEIEAAKEKLGKIPLFNPTPLNSSTSQVAELHRDIPMERELRQNLDDIKQALKHPISDNIPLSGVPSPLLHEMTARFQNELDRRGRGSRPPQDKQHQEEEAAGSNRVGMCKKLTAIENHAADLVKIPASEQFIGHMQIAISEALLEIKGCMEEIVANIPQK